MLVRNLLLRFPNFSKFYALYGNAEKLARPVSKSQPATPIVNQNFATTSPPNRPSLPPPKRITTMQGLREFMMHPATWDRNNGYFNILLGLAIFGFCFCTTCRIDKRIRVSHEHDKNNK